MAVYRYKLTDPSHGDLATQLPDASTVSIPSPQLYVDVTVAATSKGDLDGAMLELGYSFDSQDPIGPLPQPPGNPPPGYHMLVDPENYSEVPPLGVALPKMPWGKNVVTVSQDGSADFTTIMGAVNSLPISGGVVLIANGTYPERITGAPQATGNIALVAVGSSSDLGPGNTQHTVFINPVLLSGESALSITGSAGARYYCRGLEFNPSFSGGAGPFYCVDHQDFSQYIDCKFQLTNSGASTAGDVITFWDRHSTNNSYINSCTINQPTGATSGITRAFLATAGSGPTQLRDCRFPTAVGPALVELNGASALCQFFSCLIEGNFTVTAATGWWLDSSTLVTGTITATTAPSLTNTPVLPNGAVWYQPDAKQTMTRQGGATVPVFNPYAGQHSLLDVDNYGEPVIVPGPQGNLGTTGAQGPAGPAIFLVGEEVPDPERGPPGPQGPTGAATASGSDKQIQYNDGGVQAGSANHTWDKTLNEEAINGDLLLTAIATPAAPATTKIKVFARDNATRTMLHVEQAGTEVFALQPGLFSQSIAMWLPQTGTTLGLWGMGATTVGTVGHPALANTNFLTSMRRVSFLSANPGGSMTGARGVETMAWRGNAAGLGGFFFACRFALTTQGTNCRAFIGLNGSTSALTNADPSTLATDLCGIGLDSASTNWTMMCNDNAGSCTTTDLGASFVKSTTTVFEVRMYCAPNGSDIFWETVIPATGTASSGTFLNTNIPRNTVFLNPYVWMSNTATAGGVQIELARLYLESDY